MLKLPWHTLSEQEETLSAIDQTVAQQEKRIADLKAALKKSQDERATAVHLHQQTMKELKDATDETQTSFQATEVRLGAEIKKARGQESVLQSDLTSMKNRIANLEKEQIKCNSREKQVNESLVEENNQLKKAIVDKEKQITELTERASEIGTGLALALSRNKALIKTTQEEKQADSRAYDSLMVSYQAFKNKGLSEASDQLYKKGRLRTLKQWLTDPKSDPGYTFMTPSEDVLLAHETEHPFGSDAWHLQSTVPLVSAEGNKEGGELFFSLCKLYLEAINKPRDMSDVKNLIALLLELDSFHDRDRAMGIIHDATLRLSFIKFTLTRIYLLIYAPYFRQSNPRVEQLIRVTQLLICALEQENKHRSKIEEVFKAAHLILDVFRKHQSVFGKILNLDLYDKRYRHFYKEYDKALSSTQPIQVLMGTALIDAVSQLFSNETGIKISEVTYHLHDAKRQYYFRQLDSIWVEFFQKAEALPPGPTVRQETRQLLREYFKKLSEKIHSTQLDESVREGFYLKAFFMASRVSSEVTPRRLAVQPYHPFITAMSSLFEKKFLQSVNEKTAKTEYQRIERAISEAITEYRNDGYLVLTKEFISDDDNMLCLISSLMICRIYSLPLADPLRVPLNLIDEIVTFMRKRTVYPKVIAFFLRDALTAKSLSNDVTEKELADQIIAYEKVNGRKVPIHIKPGDNLNLGEHRQYLQFLMIYIDEKIQISESDNHQGLLTAVVKLIHTCRGFLSRLGEVTTADSAVTVFLDQLRLIRDIHLDPFYWGEAQSESIKARAQKITQLCILLEPDTHLHCKLLDVFAHTNRLIRVLHEHDAILHKSHPSQQEIAEFEKAYQSAAIYIQPHLRYLESLAVELAANGSTTPCDMIKNFITRHCCTNTAYNTMRAKDSMTWFGQFRAYETLSSLGDVDPTLKNDKVATLFKDIFTDFKRNAPGHSLVTYLGAHFTLVELVVEIFKADVNRQYDTLKSVKLNLLVNLFFNENDFDPSNPLTFSEIMEQASKKFRSFNLFGLKFDNSAQVSQVSDFLMVLLICHSYELSDKPESHKKLRQYLAKTPMFESLQLLVPLSSPRSGTEKTFLASADQHAMLLSKMNSLLELGNETIDLLKSLGSVKGEKNYKQIK